MEMFVLVQFEILFYSSYICFYSCYKAKPHIGINKHLQKGILLFASFYWWIKTLKYLENKIFVTKCQVLLSAYLTFSYMELFNNVFSFFCSSSCIFQLSLKWPKKSMIVLWGSLSWSNLSFLYSCCKTEAQIGI